MRSERKEITGCPRIAPDVQERLEAVPHDNSRLVLTNGEFPQVPTRWIVLKSLRFLSLAYLGHLNLVLGSRRMTLDQWLPYVEPKCSSRGMDRIAADSPFCPVASLRLVTNRRKSVLAPETTH